MHEQSETASAKSVVDKSTCIEIDTALFLGETYETTYTAFSTTSVEDYVVNLCESFSDHNYRILSAGCRTFLECAVREGCAGVTGPAGCQHDAAVAAALQVREGDAVERKFRLVAEGDEAVASAAVEYGLRSLAADVCSRACSVVAAVHTEFYSGSISGVFHFYLGY